MASVTLFNAMNQEGVMETPKVHLAVPIVCAYEKSLLVSADLSSMGYRSSVAVLECFTMSIRHNSK